MGCGVGARNPAQSNVQLSPAFICYLTNDSSLGVAVQPLGVFGEPYFSIVPGCSFPEGKAYCLYNDKVYFSCGRDFGVVTVRLRARSGKVEHLAQLRDDRRGHHMACLGPNFVFVLGGLGEPAKTQRACDRYDVQQDLWQNVAPIVLPNRGLSMAGFNERWLYVFGQAEETVDPSFNIACYEALSNTWILSSSVGTYPLLQERYLAVQLNANKLLIFGGAEKDGTVLIFSYNPTKGKVKKLTVQGAIGPFSLAESVPVIVHQNRVYVPHPLKPLCYIYTAGQKLWALTRFKR